MRIQPKLLAIAVIGALAWQPAGAHAPNGAQADQQTTTRTQPTRPTTEQARNKAAQARSSEQNNPQELGTITVTATKRVELRQDVPIAIDVVTAEDIETAGLTSAADLSMLVPGIEMVPVAGPGASNVVIRGLMETLGEPNVAFFVDGVYLPSRDALDFLLADNIAQVEVAKGPQYALYGRNAFAGAVNFVTKRPSDKQQGSITAGIGNYGEWNLRAVLEGPFSGTDDYHYRVGVAQRDFGGFYTNELTGKKLDKTRSRGAFVTVMGSPTANLDGELNLIYDGTRRRDFAQRYVHNNGAFSPMFNDYEMYFGSLPSLTGGFAVTPGHYDTDNLLAALKLDYYFDAATLTSVTSYNHFKLDYFYDSDYTAAPISIAATHGPQDSISEDLRLASPGNEHFDWLIGLYYFHLRDDHTDDSVYVGPATPLGGLISANRERTASAAIYGTATWHIDPHWDLRLALRYTHEKKSLHVVSHNLPSAGDPAGSVVPFSASRTFTPFTPGVYLTFKPSDKATFYASAVKAIKVGGFNTMTASGGIAPDERSYKAEDTKNYELGAKFSLLDGHLFLDMDVYDIKWRNQIVRSIGSRGGLLNANAGKTTSRGAEFSLQYAPDRNWSFQFGTTYNDAKYDEYVFPILGLVGINPDLSGVRLRYSARKTANLSVLNRAPLGNGWIWITRLDGRYRSSMGAVQGNFAMIPARTMFNLHTGFDTGNVRVTFRVDNLFNNKRTPEGVFQTDPASAYLAATGQAAGVQLFQAMVLAPQLRTYGIDVRYRF